MLTIADLHIHSPYSLAVSSKSTLPSLERWARIKGIHLVGTGDCTHPVWLHQAREHLEDAEEGLFTLRPSVRDAFEAGVAAADQLPAPVDASLFPVPRFALTGEISTVYRDGTRTRKVHHLVILSGFQAAEAFQGRLSQVGTIHTNGRPTLGISSRHLLELLLAADAHAMLVPAHIWTPWFSVLGAGSGYDSIDECYGDLAPHITAIETGLSSNPPMNWAVPSLDRFSIISNSDAHSPERLGREATVLALETLSLPALFAALRPPNSIVETIEFFPQEGKYHYDGHRKCGQYLTPVQAQSVGGLCPVCQKPLTRGVMRRVQELAGGAVDETAACPAEYAGTNRRPYRSLIPLKEVLSEMVGVAVLTKKVATVYRALIEGCGSELFLLKDAPIALIAGLNVPDISSEVLADALNRMRQGNVSISPGYDGKYGTVLTLPQRPTIPEPIEGDSNPSPPFVP